MGDTDLMPYLSDEARELYKDAIVALIKEFDKSRNANLLVKTSECVVFEINNITEKELEDFDQYGETTTKSEYNGFTTVTQVTIEF